MSECYNEPQILTCKEVMDVLRISRSLCYRYIKVPYSSIESYITARMKEGA